MTEPTKSLPPESEPRKSGALAPISQEEARQNQLQIAQMGEQMKFMNDRLEAVSDMLQKLPGTIGAAVAAALSRPQNASGPAIPAKGFTAGDVEFGKGQAVKEGGKVVHEGVALPTFRPPKSRAKGTR